MIPTYCTSSSSGMEKRIDLRVSFFADAQNLTRWVPDSSLTLRMTQQAGDLQSKHVLAHSCGLLDEYVGINGSFISPLSSEQTELNN
jgi:hypothetical protein